LKVDRRTAYTIRAVLISIAPLVKDNQKQIKQELESLSFESEKVELFIKRVLAMKDETLTACYNLYLVDVYLMDKPHIGMLEGETVYTGLGTSNKPLPLLPMLDIIIETHNDNNEESHQQVKIRVDANRLETIVSNFQNLLLSLKTETKALKDIWGDKVLDTAGDQPV
jgi:hypothetical protein